MIHRRRMVGTCAQPSCGELGPERVGRHDVVVGHAVIPRERVSVGPRVLARVFLRVELQIVIEPVLGAGSHPRGQYPALEREAPEQHRLEVHAELLEMDVPVVEPCFGGRPVQHAVGLAVVAVESHVELDVRADVGSRVAEAGVEAGEDLGHIADLSFERRAVVIALDTGIRVETDEELVGRHVLELLRTTLW